MAGSAGLFVARFRTSGVPVVAALILADPRGAYCNRRFRKSRLGIPYEGRGRLKRWILIAVIVVIAVLAVIVARSVSSRQRTKRLRGRFGPQYERRGRQPRHRGSIARQ
jgi:protein-S-isoprenylcysteine O-methyltransferase Ste14